MGKRSSSVYMPEAPTMDQITRKLRGGGFAIGHDGTFGPLDKGTFLSPREARNGENVVEMRHRRWHPERAVSEHGISYGIVSEQALRTTQAETFLRDAVEIELLQGVQEMITTSQGAMDLLEKVRIDVEFGLAEVPLLYGPVYERINGPFAGGSVQIGPDQVLDANVVFLEKFEAGEIVFGTITKSGAPVFTPISTYAAGFEWTEDMLEYDRTWEIGMNARAFGRSYNYLLNHLHLSPIISFTYAGGNTTAFDATAGATTQQKTLTTFQTAYRTSVMANPVRVPTVILANEADRFQIEDALLTPVLDTNGNPMRRVPVDTIIYYNGATVTNGIKQFVYPGVTAGTCYFIAPRQRFKELVHHDLRIDIGPADISRLIEGQQVARVRRGLYTDLANSVQKVALA